MGASPVKYGWLPDLPDPRDHAFSAALGPAVELPERVDLRAAFPPAYSQGQLGSCTAQAIGAAMAFHLRPRRGFKTWMPSRLFIYFNERFAEGTVRVDAGAQIRTGIKSVAKQGCPHERLWPYSDAVPGPFSKRPPKPVYEAAKERLVASYQRVPRTLVAMQTCLAQGVPIVFGATVFESFESADVARTGVVPMPTGRPLGGHAMVCVGYEGDRFLVRNSWGAAWGQRGYCTMPYEYLLDEGLSDDFWAVRAVV